MVAELVEMNEILDMLIRITLGTIAGVGLAILFVKLGSQFYAIVALKKPPKLRLGPGIAGFIIFLLVVSMFVLIKNR